MASLAETPTYGARPSADSRFYSGIIDAIGSKYFFSRIADLTEQHFVFDGLFICHYSQDNAPVSLGCFKEARDFQAGIENYLTYSYVLNPAYRAFQDSVVTGVYTMVDLLPSGMKRRIAKSKFHIWVDDQETIGYRTPGWPKKRVEIMGLVRLPDGSMVEMCFLNVQDDCQIQQCYAGLDEIYPALSSAFSKHFELCAQDFVSSTAKPNLEFRILDFEEQILTKRERDVVQLILLGNSSIAISTALGISLPTVKTHRRNIYAKLHISSQVELFNHFVQKMMEINT